MLAITEISKLYGEIQDGLMTSLCKIIRIGEILTEQKTRIRHGEWIRWVEENLPFDRTQASRYMKVYHNRDRLNDESPQHLTGAMAALISPKKAHVSHNSGENEWYTPPRFIEAARNVMGHIDTDPASSPIANETVGAEEYFTVDDNGLEEEWGEKVWLNPPYSQPEISQFCDALIAKLVSGEVKEACALVNNATETVFGQQLLSLCSAVCFPSGRIKFLDKQGDEGAPLQGQMVVYFGEENGKFCSEFAEFGVCLNG